MIHKKDSQCMQMTVQTKVPEKHQPHWDVTCGLGLDFQSNLHCVYSWFLQPRMENMIHKHDSQWMTMTVQTTVPEGYQAHWEVACDLVLDSQWNLRCAYSWFLQPRMEKMIHKHDSPWMPMTVQTTVPEGHQPHRDVTCDLV